MDWVTDIFIDCFRWVLWFIIKFLLFIVDAAYYLFSSITKIDIVTNSYTMDFFLLLGTLLTISVVYRVTKVAIKTYVMPNYRNNINPIKLIAQIVLTFMVFAMTPFMYTLTTSFTSDMVQKLPEYMIDSDGQVKISDYIIKGGSIDLNDDITVEVENTELNQKLTSYKNIEINERNDDDEYIYFSDTLSLALVIVISVGVAYLLVLISINYTVRGFGIAIKYIFGCYFISGLIEEDDSNFKSWTKHLGADMLTNIVQIFAMHFVVLLTSGEVLTKSLEIPYVYKYLVHCVIMIGGFIFVLTGPAGLAQLIGGDGAGVQQVLQAGYQAMSIKNIASSANKAITNAGALALYASGRTMGATSSGFSSSNVERRSTSNRAIGALAQAATHSGVARSVYQGGRMIYNAAAQRTATTKTGKRLHSASDFAHTVAPRRRNNQ